MPAWCISAFSMRSVTRLGGLELLVEHAAELAWCHWLMRYAQAVCCDHGEHKNPWGNVANAVEGR
jgi:hypothetical protein